MEEVRLCAQAEEKEDSERTPEERSKPTNTAVGVEGTGSKAQMAALAWGEERSWEYIWIYVNLSEVGGSWGASPKMASISSVK